MRIILVMMTLLLLGTGCSSQNSDEKETIQSESIAITPQPNVDAASQPPQVPSINK